MHLCSETKILETFFLLSEVNIISSYRMNLSLKQHNKWLSVSYKTKSTGTQTEQCRVTKKKTAGKRGYQDLWGCQELQAEGDPRGQMPGGEEGPTMTGSNVKTGRWAAPRVENYQPMQLLQNCEGKSREPHTISLVSSNSRRPLQTQGSLYSTAPNSARQMTL